jgi:hypothetical protein
MVDTTKSYANGMVSRSYTAKDNTEVIYKPYHSHSTLFDPLMSDILTNRSSSYNGIYH